MTSTVRSERNGKAESVVGRTTTVVTDLGAQVQTVAADAAAVVGKHAPATTAITRSFLDRTLAAMGRSSTESLALGTIFAAGVTGGMVLSQAPRVLVALAFLPTLLLGGIVLGRGTTRLEEPHRSRT